MEYPLKRSLGSKSPVPNSSRIYHSSPALGLFGYRIFTHAGSSGGLVIAIDSAYSRTMDVYPPRYSVLVLVLVSAK